MYQRILPLLAALAVASPAAAADIHVTPGSAGDGSAGSPFGDIDAALASAADGDRILLHEGDYGDVVLSGVFGRETFVVGVEGETARMRSVDIRGANLTLTRVSISLSYGVPYESRTMVSVNGSAASITVTDCDIFSASDETTSGWSAGDWADLPGTGISVRAADTIISNNRVRNVGYGISIGSDAPNALVRSNLVENFSRDGLRGIGDFGVFEYNIVRNAYDVDDHHDDFFQSWSLGADGTPGGGVRRGIVLRGNIFINFDDLAQPFAGSAQGIGCFDGFFEDWVIENNVIIVNHWHGITLLGARNVRIVNNTVMDNRPGAGPGPPWIMVGPHKDGTPSENVVVRNNLTTDINFDASGAAPDNNLIYDDPVALFLNPAAYDLHLREDAAAAIDLGSAEDAPALDRDGIPRPQGAGFDLGAYEWHDGTVMPVDGGPGGPPDGGPPGGVDAGRPIGDGGGPSADGSWPIGDGGGPSADAGSGGSDDGGCSTSGRPGTGTSALAFLFVAGILSGLRRGRG